MDDIKGKALRYAGKLKKRFAMCNYQAGRSTFTSAPICEHIICLLLIYRCMAFRAGAIY
jgi:hypothetical protein